MCDVIMYRIWEDIDGGMGGFKLNINKYIGKQLTVRYFGKSEDNVPIFPVGVCIREDLWKRRYR